MGVFSNLLDLFFPPKCIFCGRFLKKEETSVCEKCREELPYIKGSQVHQKGDFYDECVSPLFYRDNVRKSILRFKFKGATENADFYGKLMAECVRLNLSDKYDLITWVPLSQKREHSRGYDQAMLLALAVALELNDVAVETLRKNLHVAAQSSLKGKETRQANISGAYEAVDSDIIAGKRILLIDDIVTTGATLAECSRILLMAGAESVVCATLARA